MILYVLNEYGAKVWAAIAYDPVKNLVRIRFHNRRPPLKRGVLTDDLLNRQTLQYGRDLDEEAVIDAKAGDLDPKGKIELESGPHGWIVRLKMANGAAS